MGQIEEVLIPLGLFWMIFAIVKASLDYKTRHALIDKGLVNEKVKFLSKIENGQMSSLKWGLVLLGVGIGLLAFMFIPRDFYRYHGDDEVVAFGMMALMAGIGLVIYYAIAIRIIKQQKREE